MLGRAVSQTGAPSQAKRLAVYFAQVHPESPRGRRRPRGPRLLPSSVPRATTAKMRSDTGDRHSSQNGPGEALRRAEAAVLEALQNVLGAEVFYSQATPLFDGGLDLDSIGFLE